MEGLEDDGRSLGEGLIGLILLSYFGWAKVRFLGAVVSSAQPGATRTFQQKSLLNSTAALLAKRSTWPTRRKLGATRVVIAQGSWIIMSWDRSSLNPHPGDRLVVSFSSSKRLDPNRDSGWNTLVVTLQGLCCLNECSVLVLPQLPPYQ